jgi:hypothetical protein
MEHILFVSEIRESNETCEVTLDNGEIYVVQGKTARHLLMEVIKLSYKIED